MAGEICFLCDALPGARSGLAGGKGKDGGEYVRGTTHAPTLARLITDDVITRRANFVK